MKQQLLRILILIAVCASFALIPAGCSWSIGGKEHETRTQPTRGEELIDLKKARDQGAMTQEEYEAKRKQVLER